MIGGVTRDLVLSQHKGMVRVRLPVRKRVAGTAGAVGGGTLALGGGALGAIIMTAAVLGYWWLEHARKERERILR